MENELDVVSGWKHVRHDPWHKVWPSRVFNALVSGLTGVKLHDHNCGMKCYRREVLGEVRLYGELHRFVPVLAAGRGFRVGEIAINHRAAQVRPVEIRLPPLREGLSRPADGEVPHRATGSVRSTCWARSASRASWWARLWAIWLAVYWLVSRLGMFGLDPVALHERSHHFTRSACCWSAAQFMSMGFLAELFIAYREPDQKPYSIAERTEDGAKSEK